MDAQEKKEYRLLGFALAFMLLAFMAGNMIVMYVVGAVGFLFWILMTDPL